MSSPSRWSDAAAAGLACSMRSMSGPALLAARGKITGRARTALWLGAAGELVGDKLPMAIDRIAPPALAGRIGTGAITGAAVAGPVGAAVGATTAGIGSYATWQLRQVLVAYTGRPDRVIALGEDLLCYALAAFATRPAPLTATVVS